MTVNEMTQEEREDQLAMDMAQFTFHLTTHYKGLEKDVAKYLARQLGAYVSLVSKSPEKGLEAVAAVVREHDWRATRAEHFGYTLGADDTQRKPLVKVAAPGDIIKLTDRRG